MKKLILAVLALCACLSLISISDVNTAPETEYQRLKAEAEKFYAESSYNRANEIYSKIDLGGLSDFEKRWVKFRIADTAWRAQSKTKTYDDTKFQKTLKQLESLIREITRKEDKDLIWAEVNESLGDFYWYGSQRFYWGQSWQHYQKALDWWAGYEDMDIARDRYISIVRKIASPPAKPDYYYYGYYGYAIPLNIIDNFVKIAKKDEDVALGYYLLAITLKNNYYYDINSIEKTRKAFETAVEKGKATEWYDDALYNYAEWLENTGEIVSTEDGYQRTEPDYVKALKLYKRLTTEFQKGQTRFYDSALERIAAITNPVINVSVSNAFLPESRIQFNVNWRNVKNVDFSIYKIDLVKDVIIPQNNESHIYDWIQYIDVSGRQPVRTWKIDTNDKGDYKPSNDAIKLDDTLPVDAYLIEATDNEGRVKSRDIILVTDVMVVTKTTGKKGLAYFCNSFDGSPVVEGQVKVNVVYYANNGEWANIEKTGYTDTSGFFAVEFPQNSYNIHTLITASQNNRQAFSLTNSYYNHYEQQNWKVYGYTDKPAYRPEETVNWKFTARKHDNSVYTTPAGEKLCYRIFDAKGANVKEGTVELNSFGSAWGTLELNSKMVLGEYRVDFHTNGFSYNIGSATLFRLEEYKLPEFKVSVSTPEENGKKKCFTIGDNVEVTVQADYYFGGPVSNANVKLVVKQNYFYHHWAPSKEYSWYYDNDRGYDYGGNYGQVIKEETIKTDATGKATLTFPTPANQGNDYEYYIEARVTDASRREITGSGSVRVTRQGFYAYLNPEHNIHKPQEKVKINLKTIDANDQPVTTEGKIKVTRDYWQEIWTGPDGKPVKEVLLRQLQEKPYFPIVGDFRYRMKFRGYQHEEITSTTVKTDKDGSAEFSFIPAKEGYYNVSFKTKDKNNAPISATTTAWVSTHNTTNLGYTAGGLEIIVDKDTFKQGQKAPVMIMCPSNYRYVVFSMIGDEIMNWQLVHLEGTVKLLEVDITEKHCPNMFINADMVYDNQLFSTSKELIVPPVKNFLNVEIKSDKPQYQAQEDGTITITALDSDSKPVSAEIGFGLIDESVLYIQSDYAGDPRQFYYGQKRQPNVQTQSTLNNKYYVRFVETEEDVLIDERYLDSQDFSGGEVIRGVGGKYARRKGQMASDALYSVGRDLGAMNGAVSEAAPMPISAPMEENAKVSEKKMAEAIIKYKQYDAKPGGPAGAEPEGTEPAVQVRTDFRSTLAWIPDVMTDKDGKATIKVKYPDSLTGWKGTARAVTLANQFGIGYLTTRTKLPLIVRLQAPRFFLVGDTVVISAVINNNTENAESVTPKIKAEGIEIIDNPNEKINIPANGEKRVDWTAKVRLHGIAKIYVEAKSGKYADAMEKTYPVYEHGIEKYVSKSGKVRTDKTTLAVVIPAERKKESTALTIQVTPSLAITMLDALPYLINYPYGCVEQTMSRFLPTVLCAKTLKEMGLKPEDVEGKLFGGIEQKYADKTHPKEKRELGKIDAMVKDGLNRLYDMQHSDGGWGWWKLGDSDHFMTAYVVWGLVVARQAGVDVRDDILKKASDYLDKELVEEELNYDMQAFMLYALAEKQNSLKNEFRKKSYENLWKNRDSLNAYTRALLALCCHYFGDKEKAEILVRNLEDGVVIDDKPDMSLIQEGEQKSNESVIGTAHWGEDGIYYRWSDGGVEATAFALKALVTIDPENKLTEKVLNWLIKNRRGNQWSSTRDTAITIMALTDYLKVSKEMLSDCEYEVAVNGNVIANKKLTPQEILSAPSQFVVDLKNIKDGENKIQITRKAGMGTLYFSVNAEFFSLEEPITPAGNEIFVRREYHRITSKPTLLKGFVYDKKLLEDNAEVTSGDRVEVVITIEAKNNYEYLVFEDLKPAGLEAVQIRSGESLYANELKSGATERKFSEGKTTLEKNDYTGRNRWVHQELRDRKVALFIDKLPQGVWEIRYELRGEVPGYFHALPTLGYAMYVPEIKCNSREIRLHIKD